MNDKTISAIIILFFVMSICVWFYALTGLIDIINDEGNITDLVETPFLRLATTIMILESLMFFLVSIQTPGLLIDIIIQSFRELLT